MKTLRSDSRYASISSLDELRRARGVLHIRIMQAERDIELRARRAFSFDSLLSSLILRISSIKDFISGIVDGFAALRNHIRGKHDRVVSGKQDEAHAQDAIPEKDGGSGAVSE